MVRSPDAAFYCNDPFGPVLQHYGIGIKSLIRVLEINTSWSRGGAAVAAQQIHHALNELPDIDAVRTYDFASQFDVVRTANAVAHRAGLVTDPAGILRARRIVEQCGSFDVIHLHNIHGYYLHWPTLFKGLQNKPVVWTWHDMWPLSGRCAFSPSCDGWKYGCGRCPAMSSYPKSFVDTSAYYHEVKRRLFSRLGRLKVVAPSRWLSGLAKEAAIDQDARAIPNVVDTVVPCKSERNEVRRRLGILFEEPYAVFAAGDCGDPRKNYHDFALATRALGCKAVAAGRPPNNRAEHIDHLGALTHSDLRTVLCDAAVLLVPSHEDNYPSVVVEAMGCGTPVIAYPAGGIPELVGEGRGQIVEKKNPEELERLVRPWIENPRRIPPEIVADVRRTHRASTVAQAYKSVYREVMTDRAEPSP